MSAQPRPLPPQTNPLPFKLLVPCKDNTTIAVTPLHISGFLFIHLTYDPVEVSVIDSHAESTGRRWYRISHVPTGLCVVRNIPSLEEALQIVSVIGPFDWDFDTPARCPELTKIDMRDLAGSRFCMSARQIQHWKRVWGATHQR